MLGIRIQKTGIKKKLIGINEQNIIGIKKEINMDPIRREEG